MQGKQEQADALHQQILLVHEQALDHLQTLAGRLSLLSLRDDSEDELTRILRQRAFLYEQILGPDHPKTVVTRESYARLVEQIAFINTQVADHLTQPTPNEKQAAPASGEPATPVDGLTSRERDVLRLLIQGLTSAQMAEKLMVAVVTVNSHIRSIYGKLGVNSRSAATCYALEHPLILGSREVSE